jgi:hypothetical protein
VGPSSCVAVAYVTVSLVRSNAPMKGFRKRTLNQATMAETCLRTIWPIGSSDVCISYYIMPNFIRQGYPWIPNSHEHEARDHWLQRRGA